MKRWTVTLMLAAVVAFMPTVAQAGTLDVSVFSGVFATLTNTYHSGSTLTGSAVVSDVKGLPPLMDGSKFVSFCVDLQHTISPPLNDQYAEVDLMSNWDRYGVGAPQANSGRYAAYLYNTFASGVTTNDQRAGLALAIWNVLYDTDLTVDSGSFQATGAPAAVTLANNTYLFNLGNNLGAAADADALWLRLFDPNANDPNAAPQDLIGRIPTIPDGGATLMLLGGALIGLGALRRRLRG